MDVLTGTMLRFLKVFPSARLIATATPKAVAEGFNQGDGRRRISVHHTRIIDLARTSVATNSPSKELILPGKIETLLHLKERADEITRMLVRLCKSIRQEELEILDLDTRGSHENSRSLPRRTRGLPELSILQEDACFCRA